MQETIKCLWTTLRPYKLKAEIGVKINTSTKLQSNPIYSIPQYRDNPTSRMGKSLNRPRSIRKIIKFKGAYLFYVKHSEILWRKFSNIQATEFYWLLKICSSFWVYSAHGPWSLWYSFWNILDIIVIILCSRFKIVFGTDNSIGDRSRLQRRPQGACHRVSSSWQFESRYQACCFDGFLAQAEGISLTAAEGIETGNHRIVIQEEEMKHRNVGIHFIQ